MPILRIQSIPVRPVFEQDSWGKIVEPNKARTFPFQVSCDIDMPQRQLSFNVIASVPKTMASDEKQAGGIAIAWLAKDMPTRLAEHSYWNFFGYTRLSVEEVTPAAGREWAPVEFNVVLSPGIAKHAEQACEELMKIENKFGQVRRRLSDLAFGNHALGFKQTLSEARGLFGTIEEILDASATIGGYAAGDARSAMRDYEELARRQIESNSNYRSALTSVQRFACGVTLPRLWSRRPSI